MDFWVCPCCGVHLRKGYLICFNCWGVLVWLYMPWVLSLKDPTRFPPTPDEVAAACYLCSPAKDAQSGGHRLRPDWEGTDVLGVGVSLP